MAFAVWGDDSSESEQKVKDWKDVSMIAIKDAESIFNSVFLLMEKSNGEEDSNEITLFELKDYLGNLSAESPRKLASPLIGYVDERSIENVMRTKKLSLFENENEALPTQISEMSRRIGILESNNKVDEQEQSTSEIVKEKLPSMRKNNRIGLKSHSQS